MRISFAALAFLCLALSLPCSGRVYVDRDSPGPQHNGTTWDKAYLTIAAGIAAADPEEEVWVANGVYQENLNMPEGVKVYGGFLGAETGGYETSLNQRNFVQNLTVIDGGAADNCILMYERGVVVDGFTITNGYSSYGAAIYCESADENTIVANCAITGNYVYGQGGAIACIYSGPLTATNNIIAYNSADGGGGALYSFGTSPTFTDNLIIGNWSSAGPGGAILSQYHNGPLVERNIICGNTAYAEGGGIAAVSNATCVNNIIADNTSTNGVGGGAYFDTYSGTVTNNTIVGNQACNEGGGLCSVAATLTIQNNIVAENSAGTTGGGIFCDLFTAAELSCNDVWSNTPDDYDGVDPGPGDISVAPEFVAPEAGDYHLSYSSLCIDAGDNSADHLPDKDWDAEARIAKSTVDIGADEFVTYALAAPDPQPDGDGALFGQPQGGYPGWVWFSIPMTPAGSAAPNDVLGFQANGKLYKYDKYDKAPIVYQPPFSQWDLAVGDSYVFWLASGVGNPEYQGLSPFVPRHFEFKLGRQGWTWIGMPGMTELGSGDFMGSVLVKYPSDDSGAYRTATQDYAATPGNWITWSWPYWDTYLQATVTFTPYAPFGHKTCYPWLGYRVWVKVGSAAEAGDPDQVTLIWPKGQ